MGTNLNEPNPALRVVTDLLYTDGGSPLPSGFAFQAGMVKLYFPDGTNRNAVNFPVAVSGAIVGGTFNLQLDSSEVTQLGNLIIQIEGTGLSKAVWVEKITGQVPGTTGTPLGNVTLSTLRTRLRELGNYENSARFTDAYVNDQLNIGCQELRELLSNVHQGYYEIEATLTTVAMQDYVDLPIDFWRIRGLDVLFAGEYLEMAQIGTMERNRYQLAAQPRAYRIISAQPGDSSGLRGVAKLYPTPDAVYTLRITYEPSAPLLTADGDSIEDYNGWADYVVHAALLRMDEREQRPLGDRLQMLDRVKDRVIKGAGERRGAEPEYLIPRVPFHETWRGW